MQKTSKPKLAVGCPVFQRAWCLPLWFQSLEAQHFTDDYEVSLCFAWSKDYDGTYDVLENRGKDYDELLIYQFDLPTYPDRDLNRFTTLAQLRNALLDMVKETEADYFLSWDNDVLFRPMDLSYMFDICAPDVAVGALIDMAGNDSRMDFPSLMHFPQAIGELAFRRPWSEYDLTEPTEVDIIMAVKLMGKEVYQNTSYSWDPVGEDIAWSRSAAEQGYKRYLQPKSRGIHLYDKDAAVRVMKAFHDTEYPEILSPLSRWYESDQEWHL